MNFFLIYVGAVLVLVFYMICVNSNPMNYSTSFSLILFLFIVFVMFQKFLHLESFFTKTKNNLSFSFFGFYEKVFLMFLFSLLLFLLWVMSKFTFLSVGSIRSFV